MPNWCMNELYVSGPEKDLQEFRKKVKEKGTDLSLNKIIPYPKKFKDLDKKNEQWGKAANKLAKKLGKDSWYAIQKTKEFKAFVKKNGDYSKDGYNSGGYEWCVQNWGSKWNIQAKFSECPPRYITTTFDSPWSPPLPCFKKASEKFPNLTFELTYDEPGMGFHGTFKVKNGKILQDDCSDYTEEEAKECFGEE